MFIEIVDNGPGFNPTETEQIVSFYGRSAQSRHTSGNGIGMSVIRQAAKLHHGEFTVASVPGKGSVFTLLFPVKR